MLKKRPKWDRSTAASMSQPLRMMLGLLPPSSRVTLFRLDAASAWMIFPTSVEPVKATLSTLGWREMAAPAVGPYPGTMLTTPAGNPASLTNSPM